MSLSVVIALADGCEEIEVVAPINILRRAGLDVMTVGIAGQTVTGSRGIVLTADRAWCDLVATMPTVLVLPGGMPGSRNLGEHSGLRQMALRVAQADGYLAAICAAPAFTLGVWGLLSGRNATCYPGCEELFPADVTYCNEPVVVDGHFITACGPGVALEFAFRLVELLQGTEVADRLCSQMQYEKSLTILESL